MHERIIEYVLVQLPRDEGKDEAASVGVGRASRSETRGLEKSLSGILSGTKLPYGVSLVMIADVFLHINSAALGNIFFRYFFCA